MTAATALTTGVAAEALALTPAGYPGNQSEIKTWTYQLNQAQRDLAKAKADVKDIEYIALHTHRLHVVVPLSGTTTTTTTVPPSTTTTS